MFTPEHLTKLRPICSDLESFETTINKCTGPKMSTKGTVNKMFSVSAKCRDYPEVGKEHKAINHRALK